MASDGAPLLSKGSINLNTIVAIAGFMGMFASFVATWTLVQERQDDAKNWQEEHEDVHRLRRTEADALILALRQELTALKNSFGEVEQLRYRMGQNEKVFEIVEERIGRITENYSNQFSQMREQLGTITTQLALANDALKRVETVGHSGIDLNDSNAIQNHLRKK